MLCQTDTPRCSDYVSGATGKKCGLNEFHQIDIESLNLFQRMALNIKFRVQPVAPLCKTAKLPCGPTVPAAHIPVKKSGRVTKNAVKIMVSKASRNLQCFLIAMVQKILMREKFPFRLNVLVEWL